MIPTCGPPTMKVTQYAHNLSISADGYSATYNLDLNADVLCGITEYSKMTVTTNWLLTPAVGGQRRRGTGKQSEANRSNQSSYFVLAHPIYTV